MPVDSVRTEASRQFDNYDMVDDLINHDVKRANRIDLYLPVPNPNDKSKANRARQDNYRKRAVFYNFVKRTYEGLRGTVMEKEPVCELPSSLEFLKADIDGNGLSLAQQAREVLGGALSKGRYGLLASYPDTTVALDIGDGFISRALQEELQLRPYVSTYHPKRIINWQLDRVGAASILVLVVLEEEYNASEDEFAVDLQNQYRVLRFGQIPDAAAQMAGLPNLAGQAGYYQEVWRQGSIVSVSIPRDSSGALFNRIPFYFVGSEDNSPNVDDIPLLDISEINIGHFRNSADFEESSFLVGQPQITATGMNQSWINDVWKGEVYFGSRALMTGPVGASFQILQAQPNSMPMEGMSHKERVIIMLGAQLVTPDSRQKTATEALIDNRSDNSVLSSIAANVSDAYTKVLTDLARFAGATGNINYQLNQEYGARDATPEQINAWLGALSQGAMSLRTYLQNMKNGGQIPDGVTIEDEAARIANRTNGTPEEGDI